MAAAPWIVSDELWELIEPLLPRKERRFRYPGRKRLPDRQALQGILFGLAHRRRLAAPARRARLRLGRDLLAALGRVAARGRVGAAALALARAPAGGRRDRVGASDRRLEPGPSEKGGLRDGAEPGRQGPSRLQAPSPRRPIRAPARLRAHRLEPQRHHPADPSPRSSARGRRPCWSALPSTGLRDRRPRLRPRQSTAGCSASEA